MDRQIPLRQNIIRLPDPAARAGEVILMLHRETPLEQVAERLDQQQYVVATDDDGRVAGIASRVRIQQRLESPNRFERKRWEKMPLASLLSVTFGESDELASVAIQDSFHCVPISEGNRLFGLAIEDDIFLSWNRLESLFSVVLSDPLTGLFSRLAYERRLSEEWSRARRTGSSVGVVIVDLDRFKRINDTLGHPAGDMVLKEVARELEASMRSYDVVARFGGDEFVALCLGCDPGRIAIPVERIQRAIALMDLTWDGCPVPVTVSIGAAVRHDGFESSDPLELFTAADECLYHAKASPESAWKVELGLSGPSLPEPVRLTPPPDPAVADSSRSVQSPAKEPVHTSVTGPGERR